MHQQRQHRILAGSRQPIVLRPDDPLQNRIDSLQM